MDQIVYLDASSLIPVLWDKDPDREEESEKLMERLRGEVKTFDHRKVKIPKLQIGEIVNKYFEDLNSRADIPNSSVNHTIFLENLYETVNMINAELSSIQTKCDKVATRLRREDRALGFNDLYLAAMAICDPYSTHLITMDDDLLETLAIRRVCRDQDNRKHGQLTVEPIESAFN